ncbi:MAG: DUF11 domain-containing protein [Actinomycetota bacterium]|nr:DUF11 domain-containing protein [Actinomycetota bacterium]
MKAARVLVLSAIVFALSGAAPALAQGGADLSLSISAPGSATADEPLTFTLRVTNAGPDAAKHTHVFDRLPPDVILTSTSVGGVFDPANDRIVWKEGTLAPSATVSEWVRVTPIHPGTVTDEARVTTSSTDPTIPNRDSSDVTVQAQPGVEYIAVRDTGVVPSFRDVPLGGVLQWDFFGPSAHEITDAAGLGFLDTGAIAPVNYSRFTFDVSGEIRTKDLDTFPANTGKIVIPVQVAPVSGTVSSAFTVTWALSAPAAGLVEDVQIKRPGVDWTPWRRGESTLLEDTFQPDAGPGTYAFRSRLRNSSTGVFSRFGPPVTIAVT